MSSFRTQTWDPSLIVGQIFCMQSVFYSSECLFMFLYSYTGYRPTLDHVFAAQTVRPMTIIQLLSAVISAYAISHIIQRAKQCLDFTCTFHFWHLVLTSFYNGFIPTSITWWLLQLVSIIVCTVLGEYWCMKKETLDIPLSIPSSKNDA